MKVQKGMTLGCDAKRTNLVRLVCFFDHYKIIFIFIENVIPFNNYIPDVFVLYVTCKEISRKRKKITP